MPPATLAPAPVLEVRPTPAGAPVAGLELELTDDELEAVVGGLARIHFPAPIVAGPPAA